MTTLLLLLLLMIYFEDYAFAALKSTNATSLNFTMCNYVEADFQYLLTNFTSNVGNIRIFLVGDSLIGQMCRDTKFCYRNKFGYVQTLNINPNSTRHSDWAYFRIYHLSGAPQIEVYHLAQYGGYIHIFETELFQTFHPTSSDVLFVLFGAHIHQPEVTIMCIL